MQPSPAALIRRWIRWLPTVQKGVPRMVCTASVAVFKDHGVSEYPTRNVDPNEWTLSRRRPLNESNWTERAKLMALGTR